MNVAVDDAENRVRRAANEQPQGALVSGDFIAERVVGGRVGRRTATRGTGLSIGQWRLRRMKALPIHFFLAGARKRRDSASP
jgi:hypothetical protein